MPARVVPDLHPVPGAVVALVQPRRLATRPAATGAGRGDRHPPGTGVGAPVAPRGLGGTVPHHHSHRVVVHGVSSNLVGVGYRSWLTAEPPVVAGRRAGARGPASAVPTGGTRPRRRGATRAGRTGTRR